jgi:O-antigen/teichoic acid export membrane protein
LAEQADVHTPAASSAAATGTGARTRRLLERIRKGHSEPLMTGAFNLLANTLVTGVFGIAFWGAAARLYSTSEVGRDSALISAMVGLSALCQLNLIDSLIRFLPTIPHRRRARAVAFAYAASAVAALAGGSIFVFVAPALTHRLAFLRAEGILAVVFVLATALWGVFNLEDAALTAMRRTSWVLAENSVFSVAKIAALPIMLALVGHGIYVAWILPTMILVPIVNWFLFTRVLGRTPPSPGQPEPDEATVSHGLGLSVILRFLAQDYVGYVLRITSFSVIPLIVLGRLGDANNAFFSIPFSLIVALDLLFYNVTTSLTVEGARDPSRARELTHLVIRRFLVLQIPLTACVVAAAPLLLLPYGSSYAHHGASVLRILALTLLPRSVMYLFEALSRLRAHGAPILLTESGVFVLATGGAIMLSHPLGLDGVALAWLIANSALALFISPWLLRYLRGR